MTKGYAVRISFQSRVVLPKLSLIGPLFFSSLFPIWYGGFLLCRRGGIAREKRAQGAAWREGRSWHRTTLLFLNYDRAIYQGNARSPLGHLHRVGNRPVARPAVPFRPRRRPAYNVDRGCGAFCEASRRGVEA